MLTGFIILIALWISICDFYNKNSKTLKIINIILIILATIFLIINVILDN